MTQSSFSNRGILAVEYELIQNINFKDVLSKFAAATTKKKTFYLFIGAKF